MLLLLSFQVLEIIFSGTQQISLMIIHGV